jgi:hypothetical protein
VPVTLNRATLVYLAIFVVFATGISMVLELGSAYLIAPTDLAGQWRARDQRPDNKNETFTIHQSGRFFQLVFDHGPRLDLVLQQSNQSPAMQADSKMTLAGDGWEVTAAPAPAMDAMEFVFKPPAAEDQSPAGRFEYERADRPTGNHPSPLTAASNSPNVRH